MKTLYDKIGGGAQIGESTRKDVLNRQYSEQSSPSAVITGLDKKMVQ